MTKREEISGRFPELPLEGLWKPPHTRWGKGLCFWRRFGPAPPGFQTQLSLDSSAELIKNADSLVLPSRPSDSASLGQGPQTAF